MIRWMSVVAAAGLLGGCGSGGLKKLSLEVALDPAVAQSRPIPSITVDLIGVSRSEESRWSALDITGFFKAGDTTRSEASERIKEFTFGPGDTAPKRLTGNDPIWEKWERATSVYVLAYLPGVEHPGDPASDPRRLRLDRQKTGRGDGSMIRVRIYKDRVGVEGRTPPAQSDPTAPGTPAQG